MGYTHYWTMKRDFTIEEFSALALWVRGHYEKTAHDIIFDWSGKNQPTINNDKISFNGDKSKNHDYETFCLEREYNSASSFCKTAERPYDRIVIDVLRKAREIAPDAIELRSDGDVFKEDVVIKEEAPIADPIPLRPRREQQTKELILITWKSGAMIAIDRDQALDEILASFDDIEDIAVVDYRPAS